MARVHASPDGAAAVGFNYRVAFDGSIQGLFSEVSKVEIKIKSEAIEEGGVNDRRHQVPGPAEFTNIKLTGPVLIKQPFYKWIGQMATGGVAVRKPLSISVADASGELVLTFHLQEAFLVGYEGPSQNTGANEASTETIEIAYDGISWDHE